MTPEDLSIGICRFFPFLVGFHVFNFIYNHFGFLRFIINFVLYYKFMLLI